jgi:hypothetical protein
MEYLASFRRGWENENLARYILSRFSFIANPSTVSDDIGSDYYCTIFKSKSEKKKKFLIPKSSFAIQIKSNNKKLNITKKISYLAQLELPYFIGIIDNKNLNLSIYSGEYFPIFISTKTPSQLEISLCDNREVKYYREKDINHFTIDFPKVGQINVNEDETSLNIFVDELIKLCSVMHENISSRKNKEYIFSHFNSEKISIIAGKDSAKTYTHNFYKRLAECFYNIEWKFIYNIDFSMDEFKIYEELYFKLNVLNGDLPYYVTAPYLKLKTTLERGKA